MSTTDLPSWNSAEGLFTVILSVPESPGRITPAAYLARLWQPLSGRIASAMQPTQRTVPTLSETDSVVIAAATGAAICAVGSGLVVRAGVQGGLGICVAIRHADGFVTRYAHCDERLVQKGDEVQRGEIIARVGSSGLAAEPHLRFDVIGPDGRYVNPFKYLRGQFQTQQQDGTVCGLVPTQ